MASAHNAVGELESLLFKATNPANKGNAQCIVHVKAGDHAKIRLLFTVEDVNTIKQFCDAVSKIDDGPAVACRLLAHKVQSPLDREASQVTEPRQRSGF